LRELPIFSTFGIIIKVFSPNKLTIDVPSEEPAGKAIITFTPATETADGEHVHTHPCPICAQHLDPVTGNPRYNAETVAAIEEGIAISNLTVMFKATGLLFISPIT